jgi:putative oxidoreductase
MGTRMTDSVLLLARVLMSMIFILSGLLKLTTAAATQALLTKMGLPLPVLAWLFAVVVELGGGLALLFGLATRQVAIVLALWCVATALVAHSNLADRQMQVHFMKNLVMAGGFLYVAVLGAGSFSLDGWRHRRND